MREKEHVASVFLGLGYISQYSLFWVHTLSYKFDDLIYNWIVFYCDVYHSSIIYSHVEGHLGYYE